MRFPPSTFYEISQKVLGSTISVHLPKKVSASNFGMNPRPASASRALFMFPPYFYGHGLCLHPDLLQEPTSYSSVFPASAGPSAIFVPLAQDSSLYGF